MKNEKIGGNRGVWIKERNDKEDEDEKKFTNRRGGWKIKRHKR